jgi:hypothetical protein
VVSKEPEHRIPVDHSLLTSVSWAVRPLPQIIAEPIEEAPKPAPPVPSPPAVRKRPKEADRPRQEAIPGRVARPRRHLSPALATLLVVLFAAALGAAVTVALLPRPDVTEQVRQPPRAQAPGPGGSGSAATGGRRRDRVVVAAGDIACDPLAQSFKDGFGTEESCHQEYTASLVERLDPDAVLVLGDVQYEDGQYWKYRRSYHPTWGRFKRISFPTPARGHDRFGGGGYRRYWGELAGTRASPWYSRDVGAWHIVSLNSNCSKVGGCDRGSAEERWLRADLAAHPADCTLAFWHEPRFSSSENAAPKMLAIWQALYDLRADLVLSGDVHSYERFRPQDAAGRHDPRLGLRQFVVGTGGKSLTPFEKRRAGSQFRNASVFGVLELTLHPRGYRWRFVPEQGGPAIDSGSDRCH